MSGKDTHIGSTFESWLERETEALGEEVTAAAVTKKRMAELMNTSRAQIDRLLDPDNGSATIDSLQRAARI